jgi:MFS family permease
MNSSEVRATVALGSIFALRMLGLFMIVPVFAIYGQSYTGATPALMGLAIGIYGLSQALLQIPVSLLADRTSRKPLIVIGLLIFAIGGAVAASSTSIWGVIAGRAIAGAGAISAVVMALLADVTREEHRGKAMAAMGMSIALSFIIAFSLGPILTHKVGLSGLFWLTSIAGILAMGLLLIVPTPIRALTQNPLGIKKQLHSILQLPDLNRLH